MRGKNKDIFLLSSALKPSSSSSARSTLRLPKTRHQLVTCYTIRENSEQVPMEPPNPPPSPPSENPHCTSLILSPTAPPQCPLSCLPEWPLAPPPLPPWKWVALTELLGPWSPPAHPSHTAPPKIWILVKDIRFFACQCLRPYLSHLLSLIYKMKQRYFVIFERKIILPTSLSF